MSSERREAKALDEALNGASTTDETRPLTETADSVRRTLATDVPPADRTRALFLSGVAAQEKTGFSPLRVLVPALALAVVVFAAFAGQSALPGEQLYPVRKALNAVGIGETPVAEIEDHLHEAGRFVNQADRALESDPDRALALAVRALERLGPARDLLPELNEEQREDKLDQIEDFEDGAIDTIEDALDEREDEADDREDGGGSGSDDDSGSDDSSGPGSDNSGSDDSGSDDSSGSGSGSDSGSDDSSGSGSGSNDRSGSDDSSGSGSGNDD